MRIILGILGIMVTAAGMLLPMMQALFPKISLVTYYKQLSCRRLLYASGAVLVSISLVLGVDTFSWVILLIFIAFGLMGELVMVPRKIIPPLDKPLSKSIMPGDLSADTLVIGVEVSGLSRAYPLSILIPHHIVNDTLGEKPVAATYCPACRSGYIYDPVVKGRRLTFEPVSVRRRNMVMRDRETGSVWQHETGTCLMGKFTGQQLGLVDSEMCNWKTWINEHPETTVSFRPDGYRHPSPMGPILAKLLDHGPEHIVGPGVNKLDNRLGQHDFIVGIMVGGIPKAYPLVILVEKEKILDSIGGIPIMLVYEKKANRVKAYKQTNPLGPIPIERQWWLAWSEYHPQSELFV